jgi:transposase
MSSGKEKKEIGRAVRCIGIDLWKHTYSMAIIKGDSVRYSNGKTDADGRRMLYKKLYATDRVALEAGNLAFTMALEMKAAAGCEVTVLNPGNLAVIYASMKKTDKEDSLKLARLIEYMPVDRLPVVEIPSAEEQHRREMVTEQGQARRERARLINELHSLFLKAGITTVVRKDLATSSARGETVKLLPASLLERAKYLCAMLQLTDSEMERINGEITATAEADEDIQLLMSIPGVGVQTAYAFTAYIKVSRFSNSKQVSNFIGLVPRVDISCSIVRYGHITKRGNGQLRALLNQASWALTRAKAGGALKERYMYMTMEIMKNKKKSITAISRRLAALMFTILKKREKYEEREFAREAAVAARASHGERLAVEASAV